MQTSFKKYAKLMNLKENTEFFIGCKSRRVYSVKCDGLNIDNSYTRRAYMEDGITTILIKDNSRLSISPGTSCLVESHIEEE